MVPPHFCHQKKRQWKSQLHTNIETMSLTEKQTDYIDKTLEEGILLIQNNNV